MSLKEYKRKRNFRNTQEPAGEAAPKTEANRFVIQKHAASRLHYDFRLEIEGTLKSWAVPKGMPYAKGEKRLAVEVEDHPVSYINFEGTIPQGQYGGGTVMVWDRGTFEASSANPAKDLSGGKLHFLLHGQKLEGEWHLVRLRNEKNWLLVRGHDDMKPVSHKMDTTSAISGRSMKAISEGDTVWKLKPAKKTVSASKRVHGDSASPFPSFIQPMKARLAERPPDGDWIYEIKLDGFRTLAFKNGGFVRLLSRNENDFGDKFPEVLAAVKKLDADDLIIDGEIVALDPQGRSSFQLLQAYDLGQEKPPLYFYAFDLLRFRGKDLQKMPVIERKALLKKALNRAPAPIRFSASLEGDAKQLLQEAQKLGLEGLMAKRRDSTYEAGSRSGAWIKLKLHHEQEMVIGGFTDPEGTRTHFGSLLIGYYDKGALVCAGKVGTGFDEALLMKLGQRFASIGRSGCPFKNLPEKKTSRYGAGITARDMKHCHWLEPKLVCQVKFSEWTRDGKLRQPVFQGLREDKAAQEVIRETPG